MRDATPQEIKAARIEDALSGLLSRLERYARESAVEDWTEMKLEEAGEALREGTVDAQVTALVCLTICARRETDGICLDWPTYKKAMHELDLYKH